MIRALYGGSFDPFHEGHRQVVHMLLARGLCERVHVVPAGRSPFKDGSAAAPVHRVAMARAALADVPQAEVDDREASRFGPSWTVHTLADLVSEHPDAAWRLVMGTDAAVGLPRWRDSVRLLALARPLIVARRGDSVPAWAEDEGALVVEDFDVPVSASDIRRRLAAGATEDLPLPPAVLTYIRGHGLYGARPAEPGGLACP